MTVLRAVAAAPEPLSRADVAARTGLTKATVSTQVERLMAAGLLREGGLVPRTGAGRPAAGLALSGGRIAAIGLEIGVDYLAASVRDLSGVVRHRVVLAEEHRHQPPGDVLRAACALAGVLGRNAASDGLALAGTGVAVPGLVDEGTGRVRLAPNLGWEDVDVATALAVAGNAGSITVDNEATFCALAEMGYPASHPGSAVDPDGGFVVVSGEVGIGAGLVLAGEVVRGRRGWAGELGHVTVDVRGALCRCGSHGCLEVFAGQEAILRAAGLEPAPSTAFGPATALASLVDQAHGGQPEVLAALARAGEALGVALSTAVNLLDVDAVVLGGIYAELATWVRPAVERELRARVLRSRLVPVRVAVSRVGPDAAVLGAAAMVLRRVLAAPHPWLRE